MGGTAEGRRPDGRFDEILIDPTRGVVTVDWMHHLIHRGELFYISDRSTTASALAFLFRVAAKELHIKFSVASGLKVTADIIEAPTVTAQGTAVPARNYNRDNATVMGATVFKGPTYSGGTVIRQNQSGFGTTPGQAASGSNSTGIEYNLKPNTDYILLLTPSASTDVITIADFYEEYHP